MKTFLKSIVLFFIPVLVFAFSFDLFLSKTLQTSKDKYYVVWNDLVKGKINSDILVYGTSRARAHISTKIVEQGLSKTCYNLGMDGYTFDMEYCRHKLILEKNKRPEVIIQTLDYHTLSKLKDLYLYEQFYPYFNDKTIVQTTKKYNGFNWYDYNLPLVRYYGSFAQIKSALNIFLRPSHNKGNRYRGFYNYDQNWTEEFDNARKKQPRLFQKLDVESVKLFEKYLDEVKKSGIKMIFVYTPEYIDGQHFVSNRAAIMNFYRRIAHKNNISFLDYSNDSICFQKQYFYNAEHLNLKGANLFTEKLVNDLTKIIDKK